MSIEIVEKRYFISDLAVVETDNVGEGTRIWAYVHVHQGAVIGKRCNIGENCYIESDVVIGDDVVVKNGVSLWDGLRIADKVFIGPNATFTNEKYPRVMAIPRERILVGATLEEGASVGANATILSGLVLGAYCMVGAGSVVVESAPAYGIVYGNPAKLCGYICKCACKLVFSNGYAMCRCGREYRLCQPRGAVVCCKEP